MASTLAKARNALRWRLRDVTVADRAFSTFELNEIIQTNARYVAGQIPLGMAWVSVTLTEGADTVALPSTVEYECVLEVRRSSDGVTLTKRTPEEMTKMFWSGVLAANATHADPTDYCLLESEAQVVTMRFQAPAKSTDAVDVLRRVLPSDLVADTTAIPFSMLAIEAVIDLSATEALMKMTPEMLAARKLSASVGSLWGPRAEANIRRETERLHQQRGVGRPLRFVL
jgi:hypothetical protein